MTDTLAQRVKAQYPGLYDDLSDSELEKKVRSKYPGVYDDLPLSADGTPAPPEAKTQAQDKLVQWFGRNRGEGAQAALRGATGISEVPWYDKPLGRAAGLVPGGVLVRGMSPRAIAEALPGVGGTIGGLIGLAGGGPAAPGTAVAGAGIGGAGGEAMRQLALRGMGVRTPASGSEAAGEIGSQALQQAGAEALGMGIGRVMAKAAPAVKRSAETTMVRALAPTKEWAKVEAQKLAPEMLERGVSGSREAMLAQAKTAAREAGEQLNQAYTAAAQAGEAVPAQSIRSTVQQAANRLKVTDAAGNTTVVPGTERVVNQLERLDEWVAGLGDQIPVDKAAHIKRTWDAIASKAGLFGPKATASATDAADAWAIREASNSFRSLLNSNPTIDALNKEAAFWTGLKGVLKETQKRTQGQTTGLMSAIGAGAGLAAGGASGSSTSDRVQNAIIGGWVGKSLVRTITSPLWRTKVSAPLKNELANALASGLNEPIAKALARIALMVPAIARASDTKEPPR